MQRSDQQELRTRGTDRGRLESARKRLGEDDLDTYSLFEGDLEELADRVDNGLLALTRPQR